MFCLWLTIRSIVSSAIFSVVNFVNVILACFKAVLRTNTQVSGIKYISYSLLLVCLVVPSAHAVLLNEWVFNIDGSISDIVFDDPMPTTGILEDGLGVLSLEISGAGNHNVIGFFDFEIDQTANSYYNEFAEITGTAGAGQSWEADEPGRVFGDIIDNVYYGSLDNTNAVGYGEEEDVSFAMGWDFSLLTDEVATINFIFTEVLPDVDFYMTQADPDDPNRDYAFYFYSELIIETSGGPIGPTPSPVPEPGTVMLMLVSLPLLWAQRRSVTFWGKRSL